MSSTRDRILEAALACFTEMGVGATTVAELRLRSGASTGSIYHHFESKERLAVALFLEGLDDAQAAMLAVLAADPPVEEGIRGFVTAYLRWVADHPDMARFLLFHRRAEVVRLGEVALREQNRAFVAAVFRWLRPRVGLGAIRELPEELYLPILTGPAHEHARNWLAGRVALSAVDAAGPLADAAWRALEPQEDPHG